MGHGTQVLQRMTFFLQRIIRCGSALYSYLHCLNLKRLFCLRGSYQRSFYDHSCSYIQFADLCKVLHGIMIYYLQSLKKRTIMKHQETKALGISDTAYPAAYGNFFIEISFSVFI